MSVRDPKAQATAFKSGTAHTAKCQATWEHNLEQVGPAFIFSLEVQTNSVYLHVWSRQWRHFSMSHTFPRVGVFKSDWSANSVQTLANGWSTRFKSGAYSQKAVHLPDYLQGVVRNGCLVFRKIFDAMLTVDLWCTTASHHQRWAVESHSIRKNDIYFTLHLILTGVG